MSESDMKLPCAQSIVIHSGNVLQWNISKRNLTQTTSKELTGCVSTVLGSWLQNNGLETTQNASEIECFNEKFIDKLPSSERQELKLTVKVVIGNGPSSYLDDALTKVMDDLGVQTIETVLLSVPLERHELKQVQPLWQTLEAWVHKEQVFSLGISDMSLENLQELYTWAKVKPCINQVNLDTCCVIPPELSAYAKENSIQLLTHNDPIELLPQKSLELAVSEVLEASEVKLWEPTWVTRYSVLIKSRSIIRNRGYVIRISRTQNSSEQ